MLLQSVTENSIAEQAVIGALLYESDLMNECRLTPEHFKSPSNQVIYAAALKLFEKDIPIDAVTLAKELGDNLSQVGGVSYLSELSESVATIANFEHYERLVLDAYKLRKAQQLALKFVGEPSEELMDELAKKMDELNETNIDDEETDKDALAAIYESLYEKKGDISGIPTGLIDFDNMTSGLQNGELIIVAGRPSMGKSAFAGNIALNAAQSDVVVDFFSLEMPKRMVIQRFLSSISGIDGGKWKNPERFMTEAEKSRISDSFNAYHHWDINIHDNPSQTVIDIRSKLRKSMKEHPNKKHLVIIDYLTLINLPGKHDRHDLAIGDLTKSLKQMARRYNVPVMLLSQLSRAVEQRQDKRPMMSDLRDSGSIEQDSDLIVFLYRDEYYNKESESKNIVEIIISKQRNGPTGTVELAFLKEYGIFKNLERRN